MCKINYFQIFYLFAIEMAVLSVCFAEKGLGPLGANIVKQGIIGILLHSCGL